MKRKRVSVWGATGSIGRQTLDVMESLPDRFEAAVLTFHHNAKQGLEAVRKFRPRTVVATGTPDLPGWEEQCRRLGVEVLKGREGLLEAAGRGEEDLVVNALVGAVGLEATLRAISAGADIALANKEVLVMAGDLVMKEVRSRGTSLIPVDSEHSAVFQCLAGEDRKSIRRVILTASGGPLRDRPLSTLDRVTVEEALLHPNWSMGRKVTIDSATLMNKGLEIIEACRLFDLDPGQVDVVIHPSSIVHSMVEFIDGSIKAHLGVPDMRIPIAYALGHPVRLEGEWPKMDFTKSVGLEFLPPDPARFPALELALDAIRAGGTAPAVLNAADEAAVELFLAGRIGFVQIVRIVEEALKRHALVQNPGLEDIFKADQDTREFVNRTYHRS